MATEKNHTKGFHIVQYNGNDSLRLQVTQKKYVSGPNIEYPGFINMSRSEALELATELLNWVKETKESY